KLLTSRRTLNQDFLVDSPLKLSSAPVTGKQSSPVLFSRKEPTNSSLITMTLSFQANGLLYLLVEKLSAKALDGPTKMKILTAIAQEHNIKWESKSFGDNDTKASQDLLAVYFYAFFYVKVGTSTLEKSAYVEPFQVHVPLPVHDEKGPPNFGGPSQLTPTHDAYTNSYDQSANTAARKASGNNSATRGIPDIEIKSSGILLLKCLYFF
ncbi:hypothetical protein RYX36_008113, partial [Vicia faba]